MTGVLPPASCHCLRRCASSDSSSAPSSIAREHAADRDLVVEVDLVRLLDRQAARRRRGARRPRSSPPGPCACRRRGGRCARRRRPAVRAISSGVIVPPPPPNTRMWRGAALAQHVDHVLEVLVVAALVGLDSAMASASSCSAARTTSSTLRLWPRWTTSAPCAWISRRMMLIAASWPSNRLAAVTKRSGEAARGRSGGLGVGNAGWQACSWRASIRKSGDRRL